MKDKIINEIIDVEGGYINDSDDSGGETNHGITIAVAKRYGYYGPMRLLQRSTAFSIYSKRYWDSVNADKLFILSPQITKEVVDTSINMGPHRAGIFLQRSLNVFNNRGKLYPDMKVDGSIGPTTVKMLGKYLARRDSETITKMLNCLQGAFYVDLAESREKDEKYIYGWFKNRVKL